MKETTRRVIITIPHELDRKLHFIKQRDFYADSWSEMIRVLIEHGIDSYERERAV